MRSFVVKLGNRLAMLVIECLQATLIVVKHIHVVEVAIAQPDES